LSRKRTIALLAAFATLAALLSACGGGGGGSSEDPQKVIESATFEGVESGDIAMTMNVNSEGKHGGGVKIDLSGPFQSTGKKSLPELELAVQANGDANGEKVDFEGGITVLNDRAYVGYKGKQYEIDPATFGFVKSAIEEGQREGEGEGEGASGAEASACQKEASSIDLNKIVENLENEGGEEVEGVETTKVSGDLDPEGAVDSIIKLSETPGCSSELEMAGPLPLEELEEQASELTGGLKKSHIEIYVGESDHIIRKVVAELTVEPKGSGEKVEIELEFTLGKVNEEQTIKAPANAEPLENLFGELGINPGEILELMQGGGSGEGLGSLLEGLTGEAGGSSSGGGESGSGGEIELPSLEGSKEFEECLNEVESASEIQKCASLVE
jgi:hypothetical protein